MNRMLLMPALAGAVALPLLVASVKPHKEPAEAGALKSPVPVTVVAPARIPTGSGLVLSGRVKATEEVTLTAQIAGRLTALPVREGQAFRSGQTLASFDSPETRRAVESAKAVLQAARANSEQSRRQAARVDSLFQTGLASVRQREMAHTDREAAEAQWSGAEAAMASWQQNTRLSVPFDGVVVRLHVDTGALLGPGQPLLDVRSGTVGEIEVPVPESEAELLSSTQSLVQSGSSEWVAAEVLRIDGMIDYTTRTRVAHLRPLDTAGFEPGAYARVRLLDPAAAAPSLPLASLVRRGSLNGVYVVKDGRAWLRWLRTGRVGADRIEVLAGLESSDLVVLDPGNLVDGTPVEVAR